MAGAAYTDARTAGNPDRGRRANGADLPRFAAAATLAAPAGGGKRRRGAMSIRPGGARFAPPPRASAGPARGAEGAA